MQNYFFGIVIILFSTSLTAQPIQEGSSIKKMTPLNGPYSSPVEISTVGYSFGRTEKMNLNAERRLTGYTLEGGVTDLKLESEIRISYLLPNSLSLFTFSKNDSIEVKKYQGESSFTYDFKNMLSTINPGGLNGYFLRGQGGSIDKDIESVEVKRKVNGSWKITQQTKDRIEVTYGFEYASRYFFLESSPDSWELSQTGEWKNLEWLSTLNVTKVNAKTFEPKEYWRETSRYDEKRHRAEWIVYKKAGDTYEIQTKYTYKYDEEGREIERVGEGDYPDPEIKKKWTQVYDEKGNVLLSKFEWVEGVWIQTSRTDFERTNDGYWLYTSQRFLNNQWENLYRDKFKYDVSDRLIYSSSEIWERETERWNLAYEAKSKYYAENLLSEIEYYSKEQNQAIGQRWRATYDDASKLKFTETFVCYDLDCEQAKYSPTYKAYYENKSNSDHFSSYYYTNDQWVRFDSVANSYNTDNEIQEAFSRSYDGNFPEQISSQLKYKFNYGIFVITETGKEEIYSTPYPNPVKSLLYVNTSEDEVLVTDATGREFKNRHVLVSQNGTSAIDLSDLSPGMYFIKVSDVEGKTRIHKIVKQ
jgi:hypothetical protein